jgi:heavy metal efflux system protein
MIQKLVASALRFPFMVFSALVFLIIGGLLAYKELDIEAYPNPCPPLVEVIVQPPGWSPDETERYVTIPLEVGLSGMQGLAHIRSQSLFQLSDVKCYFTWGTDYWADRQEVINRLVNVIQLPNNLQGQISPWNAIGEVFRYTLRGPGYTLNDLKAVEDWTMERQWHQVPGVVDVTSFGGTVKEYHVIADPYRLKGHGVTLTQMTTAITNANVNVGGDRMQQGEQSFDVRGIGLINDVHDIEDIVIAEGGQINTTLSNNGTTAKTGTPVRVHDVATVEIGYAPRLGMVGKDNEQDVVEGVVLMRYGGETPFPLNGVYKRLEFIRENNIPPPGMEIIPYYDRNDLVHITTHTVIENVLTGMFLVTIVLFLFLGNTRGALITAFNIPLALLVAFGGLVFTHTSANLLSIGAIDFGIVVDSTIIMMENIFRHLGSHGKGTMRDRIMAGAKEVARPMSVSTLIIGVSFLPLFTMTGVAGVIFSPMARTYAFAISGGIILALTLTPVLAWKLMREDSEEKESRIMHLLHRVYDPLFDQALARPKLAVIIRLIPIFGVVVLFPLLGREFMPKLEEGNFWIRATLPMSISLDQSAKYVSRMRNIVRGCEPSDADCTTEKAEKSYTKGVVTTVISQLGRPDDGTDVTGFFNIELYAPFKPFDEWPKGLNKEGLTEILNKKLQDNFPGVIFNFSQYINDNVQEATAGVKGENSVKIFGPDLAENEKNADKIEDVMAKVPGITDLGVFHSLGQPNVKIIPDRKACARYGLNTGDINAVVSAAVGGQAVTQVYEGEKYFSLTVRWPKEYRKSVDALKEIMIATPDNNYIPLGQVATVSEVDGPASIYREDGMRYAPIKFSIRGRDLNEAIVDAQAAIAKNVKLPYNTHLEWEGEITELHDAEARLMIIIPLTFALISFLVYIAAGNWLDTLIILIDIPVACTGGVLALLITGTAFSVSAAMGFISVFGIAVQDALLMVSYFQQLHSQGMSVEKAAREASEKRFRPVLMTTLVATLGLLPMALSHGIGAQTQRPLAIVVIGGSLQLAILTRLLQPPMRVIAYNWLEGRMAKKRGGPPPSLGEGGSEPPPGPPESALG